MDTGLQLLLEMSEMFWNRFKGDLKDLTAEEIDWRPLPQANSINLIIRHLRIEAEWHLASLERGERMLFDPTPAQQQAIDAVPLDFERNLKELDDLFTRFLAALRRTSLADLEKQTALVYPAGPAGRRPPHLLGFHQVLHLVGHVGQISTIRNLYRKTRGEPARFFPVNPMFPTT